MTIYTYKKRMIPVYTADEFPAADISKRAKLVGRKVKEGRRCVKDVCAFDIETTAYDDNGTERRAMFHWQFSYANNYICTGRTFADLGALFDKLQEFFIGKRITICVQNLSYEFNFIAQYLEEKYGAGDYLFFDSRNCVHMTFGCLHFVDISIMHMLSLDRLASDYDLWYRKAAGDLDYNKRFSVSDPMNKEETGYCIQDVLVPVEWWQLMEETRGYTTYNMPITKTAFIRQPLRESMKRDYEIIPGIQYRDWIRKIQNNYHVFQMLAGQFQGGIVCLSAGYAGKELRGDIRCRDFTSSYPYVMTDPRYYYPVNKYQLYGQVSLDQPDKLIKLLNNYCCLFKVTLYDIELKRGSPAAFISNSRCVYTLDPVRHNGKVVKAKLLVKYCNEIEYKDICNFYNFSDVQFDDFHVARRGQLPGRIREKVLQLFKDKTQLKGIEGKELEYLLSKGDLNGIYGMMAMNPLRAMFTLDLTEMCAVEKVLSPSEMEKRYYKAVRSHNNFLSYAWGCYVTSWARHNLLTAMQLITDQDPAAWIYSDTDSVYYFSTPEIEKAFDEFNADLIKNDLSAVNEITGEKSTLGEMTPDGSYVMFKGFGAKKYLLQKPDGTYKMTVAGVPKFNKNGLQDVNTWISGPDDFAPGKIFTGKQTGKLRPEYNYMPLEEKDVNGVKTLTGSYINLLPTDYMLNRSVYEDWLYNE